MSPNGAGILLLMACLYCGALNASVATWCNKDTVMAISKCLDPQCGIPFSPSYLCLFPVVNLCGLKTVATTLLTRAVLTV